MLVKVKIVGIVPLLISSPAEVLIPKDKKARKKNQYDPNEEAKKQNYWDEKIGCYVPSSHIEASLIKASTNYKISGNKTYKDIMKSSVFVEEEKIPLNKDTFDAVDIRFGRINRQGVPLYRPRYDKWELTFRLNFDEEYISFEQLKTILEEAGKRYAIGTYRPKFGRFKVEEFEVI